MRSRPVRRVHGFGQWPPREFVSYTRSRTRGRRDYDDRRTGERRKAASDASCFIEHDGFQCGYCTPGQICSAIALLKENHANSDDEIREWMSGNICRCGAYPNILAAIKEAKGKV